MLLKINYYTGRSVKSSGLSDSQPSRSSATHRPLQTASCLSIWIRKTSREKTSPRPRNKLRLSGVINHPASRTSANVPLLFLSLSVSPPPPPPVLPPPPGRERHRLRETENTSRGSPLASWKILIALSRWSSILYEEQLDNGGSLLD